MSPVGGVWVGERSGGEGGEAGGKSPTSIPLAVGGWEERDGNDGVRCEREDRLEAVF